MRASLLLGPFLWVSSSLAMPNGETCDCSCTRNGGSTAASYVCRDSRLGPKVLPRKLPLGTLIADYDRFEGLTPGEFLKQWTDAKGDYVYPPQNGFQLDQHGNAINGTMILQTGTFVDRFGSEYGSFVSAAAAPYSQRALPPSNLDTNPSSPDFPYSYHVYQVIKPLDVVGGPIAPWFGQPGLGAQFYTGEVGNIMALIEKGFLKREDASVLVAKKGKGCF